MKRDRIQDGDKNVIEYISYYYFPVICWVSGVSPNSLTTKQIYLSYNFCGKFDVPFIIQPILFKRSIKKSASTKKDVCVNFDSRIEHHAISV